MKNILVTGASGFIGLELVKNLKKLNFNVIELDSSCGDVCDFDFLEQYKDVQIEHIFHLAAKTFVPLSWENPLEFYKTSVLGTGNVLEFCRHKNISLTFISSYLYGLPEKLPICEDDRVSPNNPYAHSKYLTEEMCRFYSKYYDVKITIARPFNIYGKNQKEMFLIPTILKQILNNDSIQVKDLDPKRDYLYLPDLISGLIKTLNPQQKFAIYNFGSAKELSVEEIINKIQKITKTNKPIISQKLKRNNEIQNVIADISKAKEELNWSPKFSFEDGIRDILASMGDIT